MKNYRRLNHLIAILAFMVMMLVVPALTFGADVSGGISYTYMSGHNHGGSTSVDPGVASVITFEEDILGASLYWLNYTSHKDGEGNRTENAYIMAIHLRPKWRVTERFHLYPVVGPTYNLSHDQPGFLAGAGLDYWFEDIALSPMVWYIGETKANYRGVGLFLRYAF